MSSIMRWRNGETEGVNEFMVQLLSKSEADCLTRQLGRTSAGANNHDAAGAITARIRSPDGRSNSLHLN
jgi:hypothetical protein